MVTSVPSRCSDALCSKLDAMNSSPACIMCFHISYARPSSLRNTPARSQLTEQPCSLASRNTYEIVISAITRSRSFFSVMTPTPLFPLSTWSSLGCFQLDNPALLGDGNRMGPIVRT